MTVVAVVLFVICFLLFGIPTGFKVSKLRYSYDVCEGVQYPNGERITVCTNCCDYWYNIPFCKKTCMPPNMQNYGKIIPTPAEGK